MTDTTQRPIRIGVQIQPQHAQYSQIRAAVAAVEDIGADIVFNWDHFFPLNGEPDGLHFEAWTMLGAWAEQTSRIEIGTLVNCNSYRNAHLQADMARTLDHISGGRFLFATGAGWFERDYDEYGYEFGTKGSRLDALKQDLPVIEERWGKLNPAPTREVPVMIGGGGVKKTLRLVARHADIWHSFSDAETLEYKLRVLAEHCAAEDRDPAEIEVSTEVRSLDEAGADELHDLGASLFTLGLSGPDYDLDAVRRWVKWRDAHNA